MKHRKAGRKYSRTREHRIAMFRNLLMNLIKYSRIRTTDAKAKGLKRIADKVVSLQGPTIWQISGKSAIL